MELPFTPNFNDKTAVVTGGAGILCGMFARALAQCGAKVAILDLSEDKAQELADEISADGGTAMGVKCDVLDKNSIEAARDKVMQAYGKCDILINGAGGNSPKATTDDEFFDQAVLDAPDKKSFFDLDPAGISFVFGLNFIGTLLPTQVFAKDMIGRQDCTILNVSSMCAFRPLTKVLAYSAAKAGVSNFTQWLAVHFAKMGIRVNAMAPGFFSTAQNAALLWNPDGTPTARTAKILGSTPMGRFGEPEDLLGTLLWLLDGRSSAFVTGIVVPVDGGFSAYSGV